MYFPGELENLDVPDKFKRIYHKEARLFHTATAYAKDKKWVVLWIVLGFFMRVLSGWKIKENQHMYITTLGNMIFYPAGWRPEIATEHDCAALRHELHHVSQYKKLGLGSVWLGFLVFLFLYLLVFLPTGLSWFRWRFERVAYKAGWDAAKEFNLKWRPDLHDYINALTGFRYIWTWPFRKQVSRWFYDNCK